ncbi:MAG: efflux RND transporter periplasmic adaptor subunit [Alphaproteobacteria bacterium]|nr:efflux RND transporter periplasmic adaptor subunit [Alphaproteobacteria bacterium]
MSRLAWWLVPAALLAAAGGGYLLGRSGAGQPPRATMGPSAPAAVPAGPIIYYRHPDGLPLYAADPARAEDGRPYIPVHESEEASTGAADAKTRQAAASGSGAGQRRILYYRNPMGLPDTSPVPKKDWMGMDYIAVYEGDEPEGAGEVRVSLDKVQRLGVRTETAARRALARTIRATGTVRIDERRELVVTTRFEGWIERLAVGTTGQAVRRGETLMEVYSPDVTRALAQLGLASRSGAAAQTPGAAASAIARLKLLGLSDEQAREVLRDDAAAGVVVLRALREGTVIEKMAVLGMRFAPGEPLYRIVDLAHVWVVADVFEQDLGIVAAGQSAQVQVAAYPGRTFDGRVGFVYPDIDPATRTGRLRIEVANPEGQLKLDMFATVALSAPVGKGGVTVPVSAVLDSGTRQAVLVERGEGRFEPRAVALGARSAEHVEILDGVAEGESVVVSATFLIDAESNLKAALGSFVAGAPQDKAGHDPARAERRP